MIPDPLARHKQVTQYIDPADCMGAEVRLDIAAALQEGWGEEAGMCSIDALPGDVDSNFRITLATGARSILKFVDPDTTDAELELQGAALAHLRDRLGPGVVQEVIATRHREMIHIIGGRRTRRLGWLEGALLAEAIPPRLLPSPEADELFRSVGRFMGRIDTALADFDHPAADRDHRWDPLQGEWIADALDPVGPAAGPPHGRRAMIERVLADFRVQVGPRVRDLPRAVIHADGNDHNLLVGPTGPKGALRPTGLIDFGDMLRTARICEPAVAAAYAAMRSCDPVAAVAAVFSGYGEVAAAAGHPLTEPELAVAATLVRMRLAISVTVSAGRSADRPDDPYVTVSEGPAWTLLEALDHIGDGELTTRICAACGAECGVAFVTVPDAGGATGASSHSIAPELGAPTPAAPQPAPAPQPVPDLLTRRHAITGSNLSLSYAEPIHAVRGWMQYLYDAEGTAYLDLYNNVPHVGHSHPHVAAAIARQSGLLATNTRYLSQLRLDYMERLADLFPDPLDTVFLLNSASEANELALRITRATTGRRDLIVQGAAYHGHTTSLIDISPYKADGPGGSGTPEWVHAVAIPDRYRGTHREADSTGARFAADVAAEVDQMVAENRPPGAFFAETFPSVGGQIIPPEGYLAGVYEAVRGAGGLVVADEVQTGFGRPGQAMWGFETQGVVPDIVVLGKPMANGFPMGALITTRALAQAFDTGMEFFSTFGGNPVACAAGNALLDVLEAERLPENAARVGARLLAGLRELADRPGGGERIGDIRGMGLFLGVEFVRDRDTREPDAATAHAVVEALRARQILAGTDGPDHNVLKLRGPLVLTESDIDRVIVAMDGALAEISSESGH